jgi:hypothetical protein
MTDKALLIKRLKSSRRRGKYAVESLGHSIVGFPCWCALMTAFSGAGEISELNFRMVMCLGICEASFRERNSIFTLGKGEFRNTHARQSEQ